jgi:hypothetical protein
MQISESIEAQDDSGMEFTMLWISGFVTIGQSISARYQVHINVMMAPDECVNHGFFPCNYWVMELHQDGERTKVVILEYDTEEHGFRIIDHSPDDASFFPSYDSNLALSREQAFESKITDDLFALLDEVCECDELVKQNREEWINAGRNENCNYGPFYIADALRLAQPLQVEKVPFDCYVEHDNNWRAVSYLEMQVLDLREVCRISLAREHSGIASYHYAKLFRKGTLWFQETANDDGWHDEETQDEVEMIEELQNLEYEKAHLLRQQEGISLEIAALEEEIMDSNNLWRNEAMQKALKENSDHLSRISWSLRSVDDRIQKIYGEEVE